MTQSARTEELLSRLAGNPSVTERLGPGRVAIVLDHRYLHEPQLQLLLTFAVNLLARLAPVVKEVQVEVPEAVPLVTRLPRWCESTLAGSLEQFLRELDAPIRWSVLPALPAQPYDVILAVGDSSRPADVYAGADGWIARVSGSEPQAVNGSPNPIGAYAAASFAVAEVWKRLLEPVADQIPRLPVAPASDTIVFSTFDYRHDSTGPNPELPTVIDVGRLTIVGLGTGGAATAWTLASLRELSGHGNLVEPDEATDTNLNRLVDACAADATAERPKVDIAADLFSRHRGWSIRAFAEPIDKVVNQLATEDFRRVVAAVHSRAGRRSIQMETPEVLWDAAATETGEFFAWRVDFGRTACLACRFLEGDDPEREKARQLTRLLGFDEDFWFGKLRDNGAFSDDEVVLIAGRLAAIDADAAPPSVGQRFGDWEADQCGKLDLPDPDDEIPIPFAPVLAGILVAGEVVKHGLFRHGALDSCYWNTLVGEFMPRNRPTCRAPREGCPLCGDARLRDQFERRWSIP